MKGKVLFVTGLAVGYVLGARAGRRRYQQIAKSASAVWNAPVVQAGVVAAKGFVVARAGQLGEKALDGAKKMLRTAVAQASAEQDEAAASVVATPRKSAGTPRKSADT